MNAIASIAGRTGTPPANIAPVRFSDTALSDTAADAVEAPRPVTLLADRVDAADRAARTAANHDAIARELEDGARPSINDARAATAGESRGAEMLDDLRERMGAISVTPPKNHAVTYRVVPELRYPYQGVIIDRATSDVVRSVPADQHIEFSQRFQEFLGRYLDVEA